MRRELRSRYSGKPEVLSEKLFPGSSGSLASHQQSADPVPASAFYTLISFVFFVKRKEMQDYVRALLSGYHWVAGTGASMMPVYRGFLF